MMIVLVTVAIAVAIVAMPMVWVVMIPVVVQRTRHVPVMRVMTVPVSILIPMANLMRMSMLVAAVVGMHMPSLDSSIPIFWLCLLDLTIRSS